MKLYIDTANSEKTTIKLDDKSYETNTKRDKSQALLSFVDETLKEQNKSLKDITEIEVNPGPGSFTGLRVGYAVGNALAWSLGLPVNFTQINYQKV